MMLIACYCGLLRQLQARNWLLVMWGLRHALLAQQPVTARLLFDKDRSNAHLRGMKA